jgi:hypothetical protein
MKKHTKVYMDFFGYQIAEDVVSEVSGRPANDIHHLSPRGMGGSKSKDVIENLVALTRDEHERAEHDKDYNEYVRKIHLENLSISRNSRN